MKRRLRNILTRIDLLEVTTSKMRYLDSAYLIYDLEKPYGPGNQALSSKSLELILTPIQNLKSIFFTSIFMFSGEKLLYESCFRTSWYSTGE